LAHFQQVDLRVAEIINATTVKKSAKLLKLTVRVPEERSIIAGIAEHYRPEELIGRQVVVVANLQPAKIMGEISQGMVLLARDEGTGKERLILTAPVEPVSPGSRLT
ncbi:MAG: methionine--tRNA ligase, partial [Desulforhopalus sp.]|nr:methionine--tRNA ligase [Desulforhopalus sp.]